MRAEIAKAQPYIAVRSCFSSGQSDELNESSWRVEISHGEDIKKKETIDCMA
jgi:hypothetical protein